MGTARRTTALRGAEADPEAEARCSQADGSATRPAMRRLLGPGPRHPSLSGASHTATVHRRRAADGAVLRRIAAAGSVVRRVGRETAKTGEDVYGGRLKTDFV
jgi:hypothetical protein